MDEYENVRELVGWQVAGECFGGTEALS